MNIRYKNFVITSDDYCFHLYKIAKVAKTKNKERIGEEYLVNPTFHATPEELCRAIIKRSNYEIEEETLESFIKRCEKIAKDTLSFFKKNKEHFRK